MTKEESQVKRPGLLQGYGDWKVFLLRVLAMAWTIAQYPLLNIPLNLWPLHWVAWVPFLWAIHAQEGRGNLLFAYCGGTLGHLFVFPWIASFIPNFSNISKPIAVLLLFLLCSYLSLHWILMAIFIPRFRMRFPRAWIWIAPALVAAAEFVLPQIFPYMQGLTQFRVIPVFQLSSITGVYGITFLLLFSNCVVFHFLTEFHLRKAISWIPPLVLFLLIVLVLAYGMWRQDQYWKADLTAKSLKVGLIQSNITPYEHRAMGFEKIRQLYLKMSLEAVKRGADWIIWSEGEFKPPLNSPLAGEILLNDSRQLNRPILLGGFHFKYERGKRFASNSAIHVHPVLGLGKCYAKRFLVPFGEYMPFARQLDFIYRHISHRPRLTPGKDPVVQNLQNIPYGFLICYEAIFPSLVRETVRAGARLLVNITYDAWFGETNAPYQHLWLASARSAENGIPLVRLGTTGISTIVDSLGRTSNLSGLFRRQVLLYTVKLVRLPSLYSRIGDAFSWLCLIFTLASIAILWLWPRRKPL